MPAQEILSRANQVVFIRGKPISLIEILLTGISCVSGTNHALLSSVKYCSVTVVGQWCAVHTAKGNSARLRTRLNLLPPRFVKT